MIVGSIKYPVSSEYFPPQIISASFACFANSIYEIMSLKAFLSITALTKFEKSSTSPIFNSFVVEMSFDFSFFQIDSGIYALEAAEHFCP